MTGADALRVRTFFATGLVMTVSLVLALPDRQADAAWSAWILDLVDRADGPGMSKAAHASGESRTDEN